MVNDTFAKDINKGLANSSITSELSPGSPRRYDPVEGVKKHNEKIHRESAIADKYKNLPFTFSKPAANKKMTTKFCSACGAPAYVNRNAVGVICRECHIYASLVEDVDND